MIRRKNRRTQENIFFGSNETEKRGRKQFHVRKRSNKNVKVAKKKKKKDKEKKTGADSQAAYTLVTKTCKNKVKPAKAFHKTPLAENIKE